MCPLTLPQVGLEVIIEPKTDTKKTSLRPDSDRLMAESKKKRKKKLITWRNSDVS